MKKKIIITSLIILVALILIMFLFTKIFSIDKKKTDDFEKVNVKETLKISEGIDIPDITINDDNQEPTTLNSSTTKTTKVGTKTTSTTTKVTTTNNSVSKNRLVSYNGWLNISNNTLVNQHGERFQLKGMSTHGIQWYGDYANETVMRTLRDEWNANLFRVAMYTGEGGYLSNKSLKDKVIQIVDTAIKLDMYVIIDWHILSDGNPLTNKNEAIQFFKEMSSRYKNSPNVIYEICNEPNGGVNWNNHIKPYAEEVIAAIRANSKNSIIIVGTGTWSQDVLDPANNPINDHLVMFALHFYSGTHTSWLRDRASQALKKIPIFVSEWGTSDASGNNGVYTDETNKWIDFMEKNNLSWANWSLCDKNESSALLKPNTPKNDISDKYLSQSGILVKQYMKR